MPRTGEITAKIEDGEICIRVPIGDFMAAIKEGRIGLAFQEDGIATLDGGVIENEDGFAQDIIEEIIREDEVGDTPLYKLLENAVDEAIEGGTEHVRYGDE